MNTLLNYIREKGMTVAEAAEQIGCARQYLYMLDEGRPAGKRVAARIEAWSGGELRAEKLMQMDRYKETA